MNIVGAFACSHAGLIVQRRAGAPDAQRTAVYDAFAQVRRTIADLQPDAILVLATDHMKAWPLPGVPQFSIGVGAVAVGLGDGGIPALEVAVHQPLAQALLDGCVGRHFDLAFSEDVRIDHSFTMPLTQITPDLDIPIVPVATNCNVPPRPTMQRCRDLGTTIADVLGEGPEGRVVLVATGGLSHWVGTERRREFMKRPAGTRLPDLADYPVELGATGPINAQFDRRFLEMVTAGRTSEAITTWLPEQLEAEAGNGAQEVRTWLTVAGAVRDAPARVLAYEAVEEWMTGTAIVQFDVG